MRWSSLFIPTLRDAPAEAEAVSHQLLVRGGFMRQLQSGHYSMLPLGWRVHQKVAEVIRQEMDAIGAQEFHLPAMHPASAGASRRVGINDDDQRTGQTSSVTVGASFLTLPMRLGADEEVSRAEWRFRAMGRRLAA